MLQGDQVILPLPRVGDMMLLPGPHELPASEPSCRMPRLVGGIRHREDQSAPPPYLWPISWAIT